MKPFNLILLIAALLAPAFLQSQSGALSKEEAAIMEVIEKESRYFWGRNFKKWKKQWVHEPYVVWSSSSRDGVRQYDGWATWSAQVQQLFEEDPEPIPYEGHVTKENYQFRIYGDGAWVRFEQVNEGTRTFENRIMEKQGRKWKIAAVQLFFDANQQEETTQSEED